MSTIKDVAKLAGVSTTTVSLVLNHKAGSNRVSKETQSRIFQAVKTLNYKPNLSARRLKQSSPRRYVIAIYWPINGRKSYLSNVISHLDTAFKNRSFSCDLVIKLYEKDTLHLERGLHDPSSFDGIMIGALSSVDMAFLADHTPLMPMVLFNRSVSSYDSVVSRSDAAYGFFESCFQTQEITKVAVFESRDTYLGTRDRMSKFIAMCLKAGIEIEHYKSGANYEDGYQMAQDFIAIKDQSQFIFCETERIAIGATRAFSEAGIKIPNDLKLASISLSNPNTTQYVSPSITIVQLPADEMMDAIAGIFYAHFMGEDTDKVQRVFDLKLHSRESF